MAKKYRKQTPARRPSTPASAGTSLPGDGSQEAEGAPSAGRATPATSPLQSSQLLELEVGLTVTGAVVGGLTGFSQVALDAARGNAPGAVCGAVLGGVLGLTLGRSLFLSPRVQGLVWIVLAVLSGGGYVAGRALGGQLAPWLGADVGALLVLGFLLFGLHSRILPGESARGVVSAPAAEEPPPAPSE